MNGIYLSEQGKQEIETKIIELENYTYATQDIHLEGSIQGHIYCLKEILESATILPVYSSWDDVETFPPDNEYQSIKTLELKNGVIIK